MAMTRIVRPIALTLLLGGLLAGCGKHYWQADNRGVAEFRADSGSCIQEAKTKYGMSENIYRGCMTAHGWRRVQTQYPTDRQFRGPEDEDDLLSPPDPLGARGAQQPSGASGDRLDSVPTPGECRFMGGRWLDGRCRR